MTEEVRTTRGRRHAGAVLLEFLGSMNLAITLLVVIAIAAVIGTVLQQNEPYNNYVNKFGPFWFEVFKALGLYDIYGAFWFLGLLGFLLVSTSVCVWRNAPKMVRDMRHFRLEVQEHSLRAFHHRESFTVPAAGASESVGRAAALLMRAGYRVRHRSHDGGALVVAGMKGGINRLGYILSHVAIVVICIGALLDGNLPLKLGALSGKLRIETRDLPVSQLAPESILSADAGSFRGNVSIPEGSKSDFVFLNVRDGYLVQKLPFSVAVDKFRLEHYATGQPKSYESDLVLKDNNTGEIVTKTISVNHPLVYKGYAIYQASFGDGGTRLKLRAWSLEAPEGGAADLDGTVQDRIKLTTPVGLLTLELGDFKKFNIFPVEDDPTGKKVRNFGPSFVFKLRNERGEAMEYVNYQAPVPVGGRLYYLSGFRSTQAEPYRYLHLPLDAKGSIDRFMRFRQAALDTARVKAAVESQLAAGKPDQPEEMRSRLADSVTNLVDVFVIAGIDAVVSKLEGALDDPGKREDVLRSYVNVLQGVLGEIYVGVLRDEGVAVQEGVSDSDTLFFNDALNAFSLMGIYGSPLYFQLADFDQKQASGLQITRAPGKDVVYLGCVMLMAGVFLMLYVHPRRVWLWAAPLESGDVEVLFAGTGNRNRIDFEKEFAGLKAGLAGILGAPAKQED